MSLFFFKFPLFACSNTFQSIVLFVCVLHRKDRHIIALDESAGLIQDDFTSLAIYGDKIQIFFKLLQLL